MVKLPEESMGKELVDVGLGNNFWYMTTEAQATKAKTNRRGYIRLKPLAQQTPSQQILNVMALLKSLSHSNNPLPEIFLASTLFQSS